MADMSRSGVRFLDTLQRPMWCWLQFDGDGIAAAHIAPDQHDTHDASLPDELATVIATKHRREKTFAMVVNL